MSAVEPKLNNPPTCTVRVFLGMDAETTLVEAVFDVDPDDGVGEDEGAWKCSVVHDMLDGHWKKLRPRRYRKKRKWLMSLNGELHLVELAIDDAGELDQYTLEEVELVKA